MLNRLKNSEFIKNPYALFGPFLILYVILVIVFPTNGMSGDEGRYLIYAHYMYNGFLPPTEAGIDILGNGPGYSTILIPFVALHLPLLAITLLNALLYYFSVILLFKSARIFLSFKYSFLLCLFWACYFNAYENIVLILPETFITFLVCLSVFFIIRAFYNGNQNRQRKYIFLSGLTIGYVAITKPIFGYVLLIMLIAAGILWITRKKSINYKKAFFISLIALVCTLPYLSYTYNTTGKLFYWSTFGGNNLYWMSSPVEGEYGSWLPDLKTPDSVKATEIDPPVEDKMRSDTDEYNTIFDSVIYANHEADFRKINKLRGVAKDDEYKKISINNIKSHPAKFFKNCISNVGRILFNFPFSYKLQNPGTLLRLPMSGTIVLLTLFCLIPTFKNWNDVIFPIKFLLFFAFLYLGGSVLASAETRMFTTIIPLLLLWIAYILKNSIRLNLRWDLKN